MTIFFFTNRKSNNIESINFIENLLNKVDQLDIDVEKETADFIAFTYSLDSGAGFITIQR